MKNITLAAMAATIAMTLTGCSVFENITGKKTPSTTVSGDQAAVRTEKSQKEADANASKPTDAAQNRAIRPVPTPQIRFGGDSATIAAPATAPKAPVAARETTLSQNDRILGGSWTIIRVGTTEIDRDENMPYIVFVPGKGSFYANNGCNTLNGAYKVEGDRLTFDNVLSTMRLCPEVNFDHEINTVMAEQVYLKFTEAGSETFLDLSTSTGKSLMRLRRGNLEFLNGQWDITAVAGLEELKTPATVFFDLTDLKLHGNTGCNFINGEIYLDHRLPNAVDFSNIITTLRACPYPEQQTAILVGLEETASAISDGADRVVLLDSKGHIMLELSKSATAAQQ